MSQPCAITTCKRASRAPCDCCSQNLCLQHLNEHNNLLISQLNPLTDEINALGSRLAALNVAKIIGGCHQKLEEWRADCHQRIDHFFEQKCQELDRLMLKKIDKQREEADRLRAKLAELIDDQEATRQDIEQLTSSIEDTKREMNKIERSSFQIGLHPLVIDDSLIHIEEQLDLTTLPPAYQMLEYSAESSVVLASNNRFLLIHQALNLCLIDRQLKIAKETAWNQSLIWDMCWSSILERFIVITSTNVFFVDQNTMLIVNVRTIPKQKWCACTCSETSLFLSTHTWGSSILEFNLLPSIQLVNQWQSPHTCTLDEIIHCLIYNKERIALMIVNRSGETISMELRSSSTLDRLWSLRLDISYKRDIRFMCCVFKRDEWLVIDRNASRLLFVTKEGKVQSIYKYNSALYRANLFGTNILAVSTKNGVNFHNV